MKSQALAILLAGAAFGQTAAAPAAFESADVHISAPSTTQVVPPVNSFVVEHSTTTSTLPFGDQLASWRTGGEEDK